MRLTGMIRLVCSAKDCCNFIEVAGQTTDLTKFRCRLHTPLRSSDVRFQEYQFDPNLAATDPRAFERGLSLRRGFRESIENNVNSKRKFLREAEIVLQNHANADSIMQILKHTQRV